MSAAPDPGPRGAIAVVLKGYPRLSETFIAQELLGLERAGLDLRLYSMRHPTDPTTHPIHGEIQAPVSYLPEYLHNAPARVWRAWRTVRRWPGYGAARAMWRADYRRDRSRNRARRFGQAMVLAAEMPPEIAWIYAHFLHTPATVARYAAALRGLPWSCSAHAKDIWTTADWDKRDKLADAQWTVTCTRAGRDHLAALAPRPEAVQLLYHGLDLARFAPGEKAAAEGGNTLRILSVGRLVEKKGYDVLLDALGRLNGDPAFHFVHLGRWDLKDKLASQAAALGLADRIDWRGPQSQTDVLAAYRNADLFVLASRVAEDGDRDGLPNVLMEAMSQGLPCIATTVSGIPELIDDGETGLLVPPENPEALAAAIRCLAGDAGFRERLGAAARRRVERDFAFERNIGALVERFESALDMTRAAA